MVKTRIILNGVDLDVPDDVSLALNYAIADIAEPEKKQAHFSRTITLPSTATNDKMFGYLSNLSSSVNSSGTTNYNLGFDPNLKASCILMYDGQVQMTGYLQLNQIVKVDDYKVNYDCVIYSDIVNLFANIGDQLISDLPLSEYNHNYTRDIQQASWNNYIYKSGASQAFQLGQGYIYPMIDYGNDDTNFKVSDFKTGFYLKTVVDKIINQAGYSYTSSFFNSTHFKSLVIPYTQSQQTLSASQIAARTFRASATATEYIYSSGSTTGTGTLTTCNILFPDDTTSPNNDSGGVWNTSTSKFTAAKAGTYKVTSSLRASVTHFPISASTLYSVGGIQTWIIGYIYFWKTDAVTGSTTAVGMGAVRVAGSSSYFVANDFNIDNGGLTATSGATSGVSTGTLSANVSLNAGDTIIMRYQSNGTTNGYNLYNETFASGSKIRLNILADSYIKAELTDVSIQEGDTVDCNNILPKNIKQRDFLSSVIKCFNLYIDSDKSTKNKLIIEPRDDFYASSGTTRDWSNKLDLSRELTIVPMGYLDARTYRYKMKDDSDYYNKLYQDKWKETYGTTRKSITNDFLNNERLTEVLFSPTPLADRNSTDRILSRIWSVGTNGQISSTTGNIRLLYYGGVKNTSYSWNYIASSGTNIMTTYPYAGHLDNTSFPTYDVNFSSPIEVFYTATSYTDGNLFNRYHKKLINEITDKDSKLVKGYFYLTPQDIANLDFRDTYYFERTKYRLNKIVDYTPIELKPTLCEFIKIKESNPFIASSGTITGSSNDVVASDAAPQYAERTVLNNNNYAQGQLVSGVNNWTDPTARGVVISGNDNSIGGSAQNISIIASSGVTVLPNVQNVSVINSTGLVIDERYNGLTVYDNVILGSKRVARKTASYKGLSTDIGKMVLFNLTSNGTYDLPEASLIFNGWSVEIKNAYTAGGYTVTVGVVDGTSYFEDGVSTTDVMATEECFTYTYRSGIWYIS